MTLIESVARVICAKQYEQRLTGFETDEDIASHSDQAWQAYTGEAKAALQAVLDYEWGSTDRNDEAYCKDLLKTMMES